jgi:sulfonate transport system substrate-binding protein
MDRRAFLQWSTGAAAAATLARHARAADAPAPARDLTLDYAYYSPSSLVLRRFGWLDEELATSGRKLRWVQSLGSNRALEFLNSGAVDFGSTAGLAAVLARANGNPVKAVYVFSRPEWTALAVRRDSPIGSVPELKGRKIAATKGTDPYLFLLRALHEYGLTRNDVEIVHLQHPDGRAALEQGRVDAWAGLDPHLAASQLEAGSRLIYRNVAFNTYGFLNVSESFAAQYPGEVRRVLRAYERARHWILQNPAAAAQLLAEEAKLAPPVAQLQLQRTDLSHALIGNEQIDALRAAAPILVQEQLVKPGADVGQAIGDLIEPRYARDVIATA